MAKLTGSVAKYPARASFAWYIGLIIVGSLLLAQPFARGEEAANLSVLDAIFTSTSASCVTGLAVRSTADDFSFAGQLIILVLIQLGGIGIMTVTTFLMQHVGSAESLRDRMVITETLGGDSETDLRNLLRRVIVTALLFEGLGFVLLAARNLLIMPWKTAIWQALFHAVSAFCNAGFALHNDSLTTYRTDIWVNVTICMLVIVGGIGFPVILDIRRQWHGPWGDRWKRLHLHSKLMLLGSAGFLAFGMLSFLILEWHGVLRDTPIWQRPMIALFHSVSCRTAGFNTVDIGSLSHATLFISILLMAIGAGPCSTAGGLKVSTMCVIILEAWTTFRGSSRIQIFRRAVPRESVERATATIMLFAAVAIAALTLLVMVEQSSAAPRGDEEQASFVFAAFEVISALGTVGLTAGLTSELSDLGRWIIVVLMFMGRLGPITVFVALSGAQRKESIEFPHEEPLIG